PRGDPYASTGSWNCGRSLELKDGGKKSGITALSGGCHPAGTGQRETLQLNRIRERKRQRMFRSEADFLTLRCEYSTSTGATADTCSDSCAFAAAGYGTDCGAKSCATGDDPSVTLL